MPSKILNAVYYVEGNIRGYPVGPIAIRPTLIDMQTDSGTEQRFIWANTGRGDYAICKMIPSSVFDEALNPGKVRSFTIITDKDEQLRFYYLTKEIFEEKIAKEGKAWGSPHFDSDEDVQKHFLKSQFT